MQVSNLLDVATENLDEMIRQDQDFKEMIADVRQGESEVLASYEEAQRQFESTTADLAANREGILASFEANQDVVDETGDMAIDHLS